jgi:hypothetical protein
MRSSSPERPVRWAAGRSRRWWLEPPGRSHVIVHQLTAVSLDERDERRIVAVGSKNGEEPS